MSKTGSKCQVIYFMGFTEKNSQPYKLHIPKAAEFNPVCARKLSNWHVPHWCKVATALLSQAHWGCSCFCWSNAYSPFHPSCANLRLPQHEPEPVLRSALTQACHGELPSSAWHAGTGLNSCHVSDLHSSCCFPAWNSTQY